MPIILERCWPPLSDWRLLTLGAWLSVVGPQKGWELGAETTTALQCWRGACGAGGGQEEPGAPALTLVFSSRHWFVLRTARSTAALTKREGGSMGCESPWGARVGAMLLDWRHSS